MPDMKCNHLHGIKHLPDVIILFQQDGTTHMFLDNPTFLGSSLHYCASVISMQTCS